MNNQQVLSLDCWLSLCSGKESDFTGSFPLAGREVTYAKG